eukprot:TRINITY_DN5413_c0_g1_i2.p1 TRINITY_DN5413_c0_g1~~TRINITY_DN5413_c0_g1_i2.p1  ORF type:complete len:373 (-),score=52.14 TRINITY_DN5413_c0_g1_i2:85-1203(-)
MLLRSVQKKKNIWRDALFREEKRFITKLSVSGGRSSVSGITATVFGATGFVARNIVNRLGRVGSQIVIPFRGEESRYNHLKIMGDLGQIVPVRWDLRSKDSIYRALKRSNVVVNMLHRDYDTRNFSLEQVNIEGTRIIAEIAKEVGVERFIHVTHLGATEQSKSRMYRSKALGARAVREAFPDATILRCAPIYGYEDRLVNRDTSILRDWVFYPLISPTTRMQPVYADDVANAIFETIRHHDSVGQDFELGGSTIFTREEWARWLKSKIFTSTRIREFDETFLSWVLRFLDIARISRFSADYIHQKEDTVVNPNAKSFKDLGIGKLNDINEFANLLFKQNRARAIRSQEATPDVDEPEFTMVIKTDSTNQKL